MTGFQPTRIIGAPTALAVQAPPEISAPRPAPTAIGAGQGTVVPALGEPVAVPATIEATHLPGIARKTIQVSPGKLAEKFSGESEEMLKAVADKLAGIVPDSLTVATCLQQGVTEQQAANSVLNQRLALAAKGVARPVLVHLSRLHTVLAEQLESFDRSGLFQRKSARARWDAAWPELRRIREVIEAAMPLITGYLGDLDALKTEAEQQGRGLVARGLALTWLADQVSPELREVLAARQAAVQYAAAMLAEQSQWLGLEFQQGTLLMLKLQDGVLIQLPAMHLLMANLPDNPDETQKFMAVEKLTALKTTLNGG